MRRTRERGAPARAPLTPPHQRSADSTKQVTEQGAYLLLAALRGVRPDRAPHWRRVAFCPCHDDVGTKPSLGIDYKVSRKYPQEGPKLLVGCRTCGANLDDVCSKLGVDRGSVLRGNAVLAGELGTASPKRVDPIPRSCDVARWQERLLADAELLAYLYEQRGLDEATIRLHGIGYDRGRYMLPVYRRGRLVNVRRYKREASAGQKMWNVAGLGSPPRLYPGVPRRGWVLLCEGEWDALVARRHGLGAVTTTGGVRHWRDEWNEFFRRREVAIVYDCDEVGRRASQGRAEGLFGVASAVKVVDLDLAHKGDLTDWFVAHRRSAEDLVTLIADTQRWLS